MTTSKGSVTVDGVELTNGRVSINRRGSEAEALGCQIFILVYLEPNVSVFKREKYPITVRLRNSESNAFWAQLVWQAPNKQWAQIIPQQYLYTEEDAVLEQPDEDLLVTVDFKIHQWPTKIVSIASNQHRRQ